MINPELEAKIIEVIEAAGSKKDSNESKIVDGAWELFLAETADAPLLNAVLEDLRYSKHWSDPSFFLLHFLTAKSGHEWWTTSVQDAVFAWHVDELGDSQESADEELENIEEELNTFFNEKAFKGLQTMLSEKFRI
jgi:hypothetical protein